MPDDYDKFSALSRGGCSRAGRSCTCPAGWTWSCRSRAIVGSTRSAPSMPRTLVVVEEGASVTYIDEYA